MEQFLNYYNLSLFLGGVVALLSGVAVYFSDHRKIENIAWLLLNIATAVWSFGYFLMITQADPLAALVSNWILHFGAIFIPIFYLFFILSLTKTLTAHRTVFFFLIPIVLFFLFVNFSPAFVSSVIPKEPFAFAPDAGPLYGYFTFYFFATVIYAFFLLSRAIEHAIGEEATRLRHILVSSLAGFTGGGFVFFLTFNVSLPPYPIILFTIYPIIIAYAMLRHKLFDVKVAATEILTGVIWITLLFRMLLSENANEQIVTAVLLFLTIVFGILLIRNVYREVEQREKIEKLAKELEGANKSLEGANERLKELDQLKSEFVSMATHQIRGPITAIKGYASMLLEGDYGAVPQEVKEPVKTILDSSSSLAGIVQDFLDVSRIEQRRMKYEFSDFDLGKLVADVLTELTPNIEHKNLSLTLDIEPNITVHADMGKLRQVIENLVDNALKYTPRGGIKVRVKKVEGRVRIEIVDTGVGIKSEVLPKLFQKFSRAEDASKANLLGTGLGLYVAR
ncbi:MAG: hypothetical protein Greene041679_69, partial [Parcubacteria group bacterium Greene0416_79]